MRIGVIGLGNIGGASNFFMDRMVEGIGRRGRTPHFALALAAKDAGLIEALASDEQVPAPVAAAVAGVMRAASEGGLGDRDWSDLVEWMEQRADYRLELRPAAKTAKS